MKTKSMMHGIKRKFLSSLFTIILLTFQNVNAQSPVAYAVFSDSLRALNQLAGNIYLSEIDTNNISQFQLQIGISDGDSSLINEVIDFDNPASLPFGFSYERNGDRLRVGIAGNQPAWTYFCAVKIKDSGGSWSQPVLFITN